MFIIFKQTRIKEIKNKKRYYNSSIQMNNSGFQTSHSKEGMQKHPLLINLLALISGFPLRERPCRRLPA